VLHLEISAKLSFYNTCSKFDLIWCTQLHYKGAQKFWAAWVRADTRHRESGQKHTKNTQVLTQMENFTLTEQLEQFH